MVFCPHAKAKTKKKCQAVTDHHARGGTALHKEKQNPPRQAPRASHDQVVPADWILQVWERQEEEKKAAAEAVSAEMRRRGRGGGAFGASSQLFA